MVNIDFENCENSENTCEEWLRKEETVDDCVDTGGNHWYKIYVGNGAHFRNWLDQCIEIYGMEKVWVEEIAADGIPCYSPDEHFSRIWIKREGELE